MAKSCDWAFPSICAYAHTFSAWRYPHRLRIAVCSPVHIAHFRKAMRSRSHHKDADEFGHSLRIAVPLLRRPLEDVYQLGEGIPRRRVFGSFLARKTPFLKTPRTGILEGLKPLQEFALVCLRNPLLGAHSGRLNSQP
jgi:hypothetical protein